MDFVNLRVRNRLLLTKCRPRWSAYCIFAGSLLLLFPGTGSATLFQSNEVLQLSLEGALDALRRSSRQDGRRAFVLRAQGAEQTVQVSPRGNSRLRVCDFPPLRLKFDPAESEGTPFAGQTKLKLVTHCNQRQDSEINVLEEYTAYRIFNLISEVGYKVRLARITYVDTQASSPSDAYERFGFFIEPTSAMADRVGGEVRNIPQLSLANLDFKQAARVFVFQYLIGNTDWSLVMADNDDACCHNVDLVERESVLFPVPYDFDLSGLVNARYARPDRSLRISRVTVRRYRGYCIADDAVAEALRDITALQSDVTATLRRVPGLGGKDLRRANKYLDAFFEQAQDRDKLVRSFVRRCL